MKTAISRLSWLGDAFDEIVQNDLHRERHAVVRSHDGRLTIGDRSFVDFTSNDYLGLASNPLIVGAAKAALEKGPVGATASALVTGRTEQHAALEQKIAAFEGEDDAVLFPTGYAANVGSITALIQEADVVFCDRLSHASLIDGCRLSGAAFRVYRSDRLESLEQRLAGACGYTRRWIVTDSVFSMDGTIAPLRQLCDLAERYDAALIVDEAHGTGVLGEKGRGAAEMLEVEDQIAVRVGTLSKAVGTLGGFVAGPQMLTDFLWHHAKSHMFSTALPPSICAAAIASFEMIEKYPEARQYLQTLSQRLHQRLLSAGLQVLSEPGVPIVPIIIGESRDAIRIGKTLERLGYLVAVIRPPTVPRGTARLRISVSALHTEAEIDSLADHLFDLCPPYVR